jgi:acyl-coenzyme A thioesterase PaaI-like protein
MKTTKESLEAAPDVVETSYKDVDSVAKSQRMLERIASTEHPECLFCGKSNPIGFKLAFRVMKPGVVRVRFPCGRLFQSYTDTLHGGVTSALLDAAMTNALFSLGIIAVTGELSVRYLCPVDLRCTAEVTARLERNARPLYTLSAELTQDRRRVARASAKFVDKEWATSRPFLLNDRMAPTKK